MKDVPNHQPGVQHNVDALLLATSMDMLVFSGKIRCVFNIDAVLLGNSQVCFFRDAPSVGEILISNLGVVKWVNASVK